MLRRRVLFWMIAAVLCTGSLAAQEETLRHEMKVTLQPEQQRLQVFDTITLPEALVSGRGGTVHFLLHGGLAPESMTPGVVLKKNAEKPEPAHFGINNSSFSLDERLDLEHFTITLPQGVRTFTLRYDGVIHHPLQKRGEEYARSFSETPGTISAQGVYLSAATYWYPWFSDDLQTFVLDVTVDQSWDVVSQGKRTLHQITDGKRRVVWDSSEPQDEIYLVAAQFVEYSRSAGAVEAQAFLRTKDDALANKYLEVTAQYLEMYRQLIGPYPYSKFALVENFWETGYGMPSFTLLGPQIIRFPFILHSSYPHEILHNWWGNSVFVDYPTGNWCEGLTAYLADHLIQEQRGAGVKYRRATLQKYTDYVKKDKDFPLSEFRSRHSSVTEAVGYGKTLMLFHMLRQKIGDDLFVRGLQQFYRQYRYKRASFSDVASVFSDIAETDLSSFFEQWVQRPGAPELRLATLEAVEKANRWQMTLTLEQIQDGDAFVLDVPVAITLENSDKAFQQTIPMLAKNKTVTLSLPARPLRVDVDPEFDVFRRLHRNEIPPALSQMFGAEQVVLVLPASAENEILQGYQAIADDWQKSQRGHIEVVHDSELSKLPGDKAVWLFGFENRFLTTLQQASSDYDIDFRDEQIRIGKQMLLRQEHSVITTARNPDNADFSIALLATMNPAAMPGLARKLPHYGKYSYLAFKGDEPENFFKGQWPAVHSPLTRRLADKNGAAAARPGRKALASLAPVFSQERMLRDVTWLASDTLKGRGAASAELERAAGYIADVFRQAGLQPGSDEQTFFQVWQEKYGPQEQTATLKNVVGIIPGTNPKYEGQSVVIGAHYDHLGTGWPDVHSGDEGKIHPGADDNASGVAVLLELARILGKNMQPERTVVFVAFSGEEAGLLGSKYYVKSTQRFPVSRCIGMLNLDTVGRLGTRKITIFGTGSASEWVHIFRGAGFVTGIQVESVADDFGSSDQKSFLDAQVPAVQFFSGVHLDYHRPGDTADKIDAAGMVKVAAIVREAVEYLAGREQPMTAQFAGKQSAQQTRPRGGSGRRVSFGSVPDFAFSGPGVRITGTTPGSAAEKAGLKKGDVIISLAGKDVKTLRDLSTVLRALNPGDEIDVRWLREGRELQAKTTVSAR